MNTNQLKYAITLARTRNFTQAAAQLNMSQPTLSKHIRALEEELGVTLFDRSSAPLKLTDAGECFVREAWDLLQKEGQLRTAMSGFQSGDRGRLVIGISPFRCSYLIPDVAKKLRDEFPGLQIILRELNSLQLHQGATEGEFDLAVINLPVDEALLSVKALKSESLVLAVPEALACGLPEGGSICLEDAASVPFVVLSEKQELRRLFDSLCAGAAIQPRIAAEVVGILSSWFMAKAGVGAALLPDSFTKSLPREGMRFYDLQQDSRFRRPVIAYRKDRPLSVYARRAIALLAQE